MKLKPADIITAIRNDAKKQFVFLTALLFLLGTYNIFYKIRWENGGIISAFNLWNPVWLLFSPILYFAYRIITNKALKSLAGYAFHCLPFIIFTIFYLSVLYGTDMKDPWKSNGFNLYQNSYYIFIISLVSYNTYILIKIFMLGNNCPDRESALIITMATFNLMIGILTMLMFMSWGIIYFDMGFDYRYFSYALLLLINIVLIRYWIVTARSKLQASDFCSPETVSYQHSALPEKLAIEYQEKIRSFFEESKAYLIPHLSQALLSEELGIPKHYLSQLFNVHFKTGFHSFIAHYRIAHAIALLTGARRKLKLETLAFECGFNSKTSFNRYFKEITGVSPSEFDTSSKVRSGEEN